MSVHDIQQKGLLNKISVYTFTHPDGHHHVGKVTLFVVWTCHGCATFWSPVTSLEVMWITWSPLWHSTHLTNSEIFIYQNNTFFIATAHDVEDADCSTGVTMGILFTFLRVLISAQGCRQTNGVNREAKNNMVLYKICGCHFCPLSFYPTKS